MPRKDRRADLFFIAAPPSGAMLRHAWRQLEVRRDGAKPWGSAAVWTRVSHSKERVLGEWQKCIEEESLLPLEDLVRLPDEFNLVLLTPEEPLTPAAIIREELLEDYKAAVQYQHPLLFDGKALFGPFFWKLSPSDDLLNEEELRLVFLDTVDAERRKFERLRRQFDQAGQVVQQPRRERISEDIRIFVWRRDEGQCVRCGSQKNLEFDHIVPVSKGGSNTSRNVQILCEACNRQKGAEVA